MARFDNLGKAIGIAVSKDEQGIRALLQRNGVSTAQIKTKKQLSDIFVESLVRSKGLGQDFASYIKSKDNANMSGYMKNMSGEVNIIGDEVPEAYNMTGLPYLGADGEEEEKVVEEKKGFFSGLNLQDLINTATTIYLAEQKGKITQQETQQMQIASQVQLNNELDPKEPNKKSNTGTIVVFSVLGLAVIGTVVFFALKKK